MAFLVIQDFSSVTVKHLSLLAWCPKTEVEMYLEHKAKQMEEDYNTTLERDCWKTHPLYKERRSMLEEKCSKEGLDTRGGKHCLVRWIVKQMRLKEPEPMKEFSGNMAEIPVNAKQLSNLPLSKLKQILKFHNIPTEGTKDQLVLRVLAIHSGTKHLLFERETQDLLSFIEVISTSLIWKQKEQAVLNEQVKYRVRSSQTQEKPSFLPLVHESLLGL